MLEGGILKSQGWNWPPGLEGCLTHLIVNRCVLDTGSSTHTEAKRLLGEARGPRRQREMASMQCGPEMAGDRERRPR